MKTHYDILGVAPDASSEAIKLAYRKALKQSHPDLHDGDGKAAERSKAIIDAHAVLKDPDQRARYDNALRLRRQQGRRLFLIIFLVSGGLVCGASLFMLHIAVGPERPRAVVAAQMAPDAVARPELATTPRHEPVAVIPEAVAGAFTVADQRKALADLDAAIRVGSAHPTLFHERGLLRLRLGNEAGAMADFDRAIELGGGALAYRDRGKIWFARRHFDRALADFNSAIRTDPHLASAYFHRGLVHGQTGDVHKATADFLEAASLDPTLSEARAAATALHEHDTARHAEIPGGLDGPPAN